MQAPPNAMSGLNGIPSVTRAVRQAELQRKTNETDISLKLALDLPVGAQQQIDIKTGIGFLDHVGVRLVPPAAL